MSRRSTKKRPLCDENDNDACLPDNMERQRNADTDSTSSSEVARKRRRSNDSNSTGSDERDEEQLRQIISSSQYQQRCGKIVRMRLVNIMCHSNLSVEFNQRGNYIVGANGSGKSAILTALMLGLGGRAKDSGRSSSTKDLIKRDQTHAKVEITISNDGEHPYEPEKYGGTITVVRSLHMASSTYALKSESGQVVSKKSEDLHRMLMFHNIQVNNPVFVMNQDNGREFLKQMTPKKNFQLFVKATHIEAIMESLITSEQSYQSMLTTLGYKQMRSEQLKTEMKGLQVKLSKCISAAKMRAGIRSMERELMWLRVGEHETALQEHMLQYPALHQQAKKLQDLQCNKKQLKENHEQEVRDIEAQLKAMQDEATAAYATFMASKNDEAAKHVACKDLREQITMYKDRLQRVQVQIDGLQGNIVDKQQNNMGDVASLRESNEQKLQQLRAELEETAAIIASGRRDCKMFSDSRLQKDEQFLDIKRKLTSFKEQIAQTDRAVASMKNSVKDRLALFGPEASQLVAEIHKARSKFSEMPLGPLGQYVQVPDAKYSAVVEHLLGGVLQMFLVNSSQDRQVLDQIIKAKLPHHRPAIITTKFVKKVYDVSKGCVQPPNGTELLMNIIQCSNPVVMNCLIDRCQIESILVTTSKQIGEQFTADIENVPRNLQRIAVNTPKMCLQYYPAPRYRVYSRTLENARLLQVNVQERINQLLSAQQQWVEQSRQLSEEYTQLNREQQEINRHIVEKRQLTEQQEVRQQELKEKIDELESFEYPSSDYVEMLQKEIVEQEQLKEKLVQKIRAKKKEFEKARTEQQSAAQKLNEGHVAMKRQSGEVDEKKKLLEDKKRQLRMFDLHVERCVDELLKINQQLAELDRTKDQLQQRLDEAKQAAEKCGARVETKRTAADLEDTIRRHNKTVELNQAQGDDPDELRRQIDQLREEYTTEKARLSKYESSLNSLHNSMKLRFSFMNRYKRHVGLQLSLRFHNILNQRGFNGNIEIDNENGTLNMEVTPRLTQEQEHDVAGTKSLSGGERSYTTLAFLLSLWNCVDHPFYFLDEYDVFTDEVNRSLMNSLLLQEIKKRPNRQFCFLTPQTMSLQSSEDVKILQLDRPTYTSRSQ